MLDVIHSHKLATTVHCKLGGSDVHYSGSCFFGENRSYCGAAGGVVFHDELLEWDLVPGGQGTNYAAPYSVGCISLICVGFYYEALVDLRSVGILMVAGVVWMLPVSHICGKDETAAEDAVISIWRAVAGEGKDYALE